MPDEASGSHRVARVLGVSAVLVFAAIFLAPMLKTGYISDDVVSSLMPGMTKFTGQSVVSRTLSHMRSSMLEGRFYPLVWLQYYAVFFSLQNVLLYKSFILAMVLLDLLLFVVFVRMSARDDGLALLAATLTVPLFQFRAFFDPILAFHGLLQFIVAGILLSLLSLQRFLEGRGRVWLVLSVMTFLACCLAYEVCYPLVFLYVPSIASGCRDWRSRWTTFRPYLTAVGACVTLSILMRWLHPSPSYIHGVSHDPSAIVVAMATQTSSALPLSYFLADPAGLFTDAHGFSAILRWMARPDAGIVTALASLVVGICLRSRPAALAETVPAVPSGRLGVLPQVGLLLAVLPAVMIAISSRYQAQIRFGKGYLPVYVQYFGVGLLLAWLIRSALDRLASRVALTRVARVALTVVVGITTCLTYRANCTTAVGLVSPPGSRTFNQEAAWNDGIWHDRRNNLEAALHAGLLDDVPEHSQVILEN
ncbi:MAG: hypothetical protein JWN86_237, partial [Planctomycetota bacterium]|nr:hypothetical protein [Planctomycetota bacterium]